MQKCAHWDSAFFTSTAWDQKNSFVMSQACEAMPLYWGMVPEDKKEDVVRTFRQTLTEKDCLASGETGMPYIIRTAGEYGMNDLIADFITREDHPSCYAFVKGGMTTLGNTGRRISAATAMT